MLQSQRDKFPSLPSVFTQKTGSRYNRLSKTFGRGSFSGRTAGDSVTLRLIFSWSMQDFTVYQNKRNSYWAPLQPQIDYRNSPKIFFFVRLSIYFCRLQKLLHLNILIVALDILLVSEKHRNWPSLRPTNSFELHYSASRRTRRFWVGKL